MFHRMIGSTERYNIEHHQSTNNVLMCNTVLLLFPCSTVHLIIQIYSDNNGKDATPDFIRMPDYKKSIGTIV